ncbi:MAG: Abi family protein [Arcobacteraceae bacterium]|jgi:abortive infection bacteriophage resistance protein
MSPLHEQLQKLKNHNNLYTKEHKTFQEQLEKLLGRNLIVANKQYALSKLEHINYYRLSAYFLPYQYEKESQNANLFLPETTFEEIIRLYYFDTELRKIIFEAIEVIEIYLRTQIAYYHSQKYGAFGYLDSNNLRTNYQAEFDALHQDIIKEKERSKEVFIKHFQEKYNTSDLPIWSVVEIISFGSLSKLFMLLQENEQNQVIAKMGNINKVVFFKWFKALSSVRNACAHHSRLWNKTLGVGFEVPRKNPAFTPLSQSSKKIFFALSVIEYILACIGEDEIDFKQKIKQLFQKYPHVDKQAMGFVENWENLEIWKN